MSEETLWRIYNRLSSNRDGKASNVKEQDFDNRNYADDHRLSVVEPSYVDDGKSASDHSRARRDGFEDLIADIKEDTRAGKTCGILCTELTRLYRRPRELEEILDPADRTEIRVRIRTTDDGKEWDLRTANGRRELRDTVNAAAWYSDYVSEKVRKKAKHRALVGRRNGGGPGYGFNLKNAVRDNQGSILEYEQVTINEPQAEIIREVAERALAGQTIRSICNDLNRRREWTRRGKRWTASTMQRLLTNPAIAGLVRHKDLPELVQAQWPAIIPESEWRKLQAALTKPGRRTNFVNARTALLAGFLYCGICGKKLTADRNQDGKRVYTCRRDSHRQGCGRLKRLGDPVDQLITELVISTLEDSDFKVPIADDDEFAKLYAQKKELEDSLAQLTIDHYRLKLIGRPEFLAAHEALAADIATIQRRLDRATTHRHVKELPVGEVAQEEWDAHENDLAWRRELIGLVLNGRKVIIKPMERPRVPYNEHFGARFDPDSIDFDPPIE